MREGAQPCRGSSDRGAMLIHRTARDMEAFRDLVRFEPGNRDSFLHQCNSASCIRSSLRSGLFDSRATAEANRDRAPRPLSSEMFSASNSTGAVGFVVVGAM